MELLLNALWLLASTGGIAWAVRGRRSHHSHRQSRQFALIASICVVVLLFPVISVTDDLQGAQSAIEDVGLKKLKSASDVDGNTLRVLHADILTVLGWPSLIHTEYIVTKVASLLVLSPSLPVRIGRAPPSTLF